MRTGYLLGGYGTGVELLTIPDRVVDRVTAYLRARNDFAGAHALAMAGADHGLPPSETSELVRQANTAQDGFRLRIAMIAEYLGRPLSQIPSAWPLPMQVRRAPPRPGGLCQGTGSMAMTTLPCCGAIRRETHAELV